MSYQIRNEKKTLFLPKTLSIILIGLFFLFKSLVVNAFSATEQNQLVTRIQYAEKQINNNNIVLPGVPSDGLPSNISLEMNGVPVLNQGSQGTCGTFATTAALDALYGHGDYISQYCYLQAFHKWGEGNDEPKAILSDLISIGVISTEYQRRNGCGGVHEYPLFGSSNLTSLFSQEDYNHYSEKIFSNVKKKAIEQDPTDLDGTKFLTKIKEALFHQHRVILTCVIDYPLDGPDPDIGGGYYQKEKSDRPREAGGLTVMSSPKGCQC